MRELPISWAWTTIDEIASTSSGGTPSRTRPDYYGGSIPWVKSGELNDGLVRQIEETITEDGLKNSSAKIFPSGTLCIALYGATVGKVGILAADAATNQAVCGINPHAQIGAKYLFYFFQSQRSALIGLSQGGAQPNISQQIVRSTTVPICARAEQDRIVAEVEKQFTRLDAATAALKRVQANLKRYRASVLKAACEGRLVPTEAELARKEGRDYEPASELLKRILRERRARWEADTLAKMIASGKRPTDDRWKQKYNEPSAPTTTNLPDLPEGWCWTAIEQVSECLDNKRVPINKEERARRGGEVPYYGANGRVGWIDEYLFDEPLVLVVEDETFVGREIPFSYLIKGKSWVNNHAHILRALDGLQTEFLNYSLAYYPFTPLTTGSTGRRKLTQKSLTEAPYALPPRNEQIRIVAEVERLLSLDDAIRNVLETTTARAGSLRQSILRSAFTGQLVPQDATDEPASVLLERIRAERKSGYSRPPRRSRKAATNG